MDGFECSNTGLKSTDFGSTISETNQYLNGLGSREFVNRRNPT
jgi:hypothetical protein